MARSRDLHRFFWEQTAQALLLTDMSIDVKGWGTSHRITVSGQKSGFELEAGTYWEGSGESSVQYSFASVPLSGLPDGFAVDGLFGISATYRVDVRCESGRVRTITLSSVPVRLGGLRLEQLSVDLDEFLTARRREAICSIEGSLVPEDGHHRLERRVQGDPLSEEANTGCCRGRGA